MKKVLYLLLFVLLSFSANAQNFVSNNYQNFLEADNSTVVQVHGVSFQLAADFLEEAEGDKVDEIRETLRKVKAFQLVAMPDLESPLSEYEQGLKKLGNSFDELVNVKDKGNRFSIHIDEEDGIVYEVVGLGTETDEGRFIAFSVTGEIPLDMIGEIMNNVQSKGGKDLAEMLEDTDIQITNLKVFPNPISTNNEITLEVPDNLIGGEGLFIDLNGKVISQFDVTDSVKEIKTNGLAPGYYFISVTKDGKTMKRKINIIQ